MKYKHVFCDLDGTLFGKDLVVSDRVAGVVNGLGETGFSICTARGSSEAFPLLDKIRLTSPSILENGATIFSADKQVLRQNFLNEDEVMSIVEILGKYSVWKKICVNGQLHDFGDNVDFGKVTKIALQDLTEDTHSEISKELSKYSDIYYSKSHAAHKPGFLTMDISNAESTKQEAVHYVMQLLGIEKSETIGIGDSYNDFPLLMACGL